MLNSTRPEDHETLLALASRAWEPVFASVNDVLGADLALLLHGEDWRTHHAGEIRQILGSDSMETWVADLDGRPVGFVTARVADPTRRIGEIHILGVGNPVAQHQGVGTALIRYAEAWLHEQGMAVAYIGSGGDNGHAPARSLYQSLGYRTFPSAQYYKVLPGQGVTPPRYLRILDRRDPRWIPEAGGGLECPDVVGRHLDRLTRRAERRRTACRPCPSPSRASSLRREGGVSSCSRLQSVPGHGPRYARSVLEPPPQVHSTPPLLTGHLPCRESWEVRS